MKHDRLGVVIVGAGLAGVECAFALRENGESRPITILGDEPCMPYDRPPLSKAYLKGALSREHLWLRTDEQYADSQIEVRLGVSVTAIDPAVRRVRLDNGQTLYYEQLVLATGGEARRSTVPGSCLKGVMSLKSLADADMAMQQIKQCPSIVIIGGGYIGMEFAATARMAGCKVTLIEEQATVLSRSMSPVIAGYLQELHESHGVTILTQARAAQIEGSSHTESVLLDDDRRLPADMVLISIGNQANDLLARKAKLALADNGGILVDADGRTSDANIYAAGDCASRLYAEGAKPVRLESVHCAVTQAKRVAATLTGRQTGPEEVPWFWSDQFDAKLQMAGMPTPADVEIVRGDPKSGRFSVIYQNQRSMTAIQCVNSSGDFIAGKKLIAQQRLFADELLRDQNIRLRDLAKAGHAEAL